VADCFISYASVDDAFAQFVAQELRNHGVTVFLASDTLTPGDEWTQAVWNNLHACPWVIVLASRAGCRSAYVQQEAGHALLSNKKVIPVVWDMSPAELPGWLNRRQAIDLSAESLDSLRGRVADIAGRVHADRRTGMLILGGLVLALLAASKAE
jgi:hypothetical protein